MPLSPTSHDSGCSPRGRNRRVRTNLSLHCAMRLPCVCDAFALQLLLDVHRVSRSNIPPLSHEAALRDSIWLWRFGRSLSTNRLSMRNDPMRYSRSLVRAMAVYTSLRLIVVSL